MKKTLVALLIVVLTIPSIAIAKNNLATLIDNQGNKIIVTVGTWPATGTWKLFKEDKQLGTTVSTGYQSKLTNSITAGASTIYVSKTTDINGISLPLSATEKGYFNIEPGGARQEPIVCTGVTATALTGCTRGLVATGISETGSSTLAFAHNAGANIIMTNISQFYGNFVDLSNNQTIGGNKTFTGSTTFTTLPISTTAVPTTNGMLANKAYVDIIGASGVTINNASTTRGIEAFAGSPVTLGVKASTTGGIAIDTSGNIYVNASTTKGIGYQSDGTVYFNGFDNANTWTGTNSFSATTTSSGIVAGFSGFGGDGSDGVLNITSGTTTLDSLGVNILEKNYSSINIASGSVLTIATTTKAADGVILVLKSRGNCTIAGKIDLMSLGANASSSGYGILDVTNNHAGNVGNPATTNPGGTMVGGTILGMRSFYPTASSSALSRKFVLVAVGSGGNTGGIGNNESGGEGQGGVGGNGGGSIIIECAGTLNFVAGSEINVNGSSGYAGTGVATSGGGGGGSGGSAGMALIMYNFLSNNAGTINAKGGAGGAGGSGGGSGTCTSGDVGGGAGSGAASLSSDGITGAAGSTQNVNGATGTATTNASGASGGSGAGCGASTTGGPGGAQGNSDTNHYKVVKNSWF